MDVAVLVGNGVNNGASVGTCASGVALSGAQAVSRVQAKRADMNLVWIIFNKMLN